MIIVIPHPSVGLIEHLVALGGMQGHQILLMQRPGCELAAVQRLLHGHCPSIVCRSVVRTKTPDEETANLFRDAVRYLQTRKQADLAAFIWLDATPRLTGWIAAAEAEWNARPGGTQFVGGPFPQPDGSMALTMTGIYPVMIERFCEHLMTSRGVLPNIWARAAHVRKGHISPLFSDGGMFVPDTDENALRLARAHCGTATVGAPVPENPPLVTVAKPVSTGDADKDAEIAFERAARLAGSESLNDAASLKPPSNFVKADQVATPKTIAPVSFTPLAVPIAKPEPMPEPVRGAEQVEPEIPAKKQPKHADWIDQYCEELAKYASETTGNRHKVLRAIAKAGLKAKTPGNRRNPDLA